MLHYGSCIPSSPKDSTCPWSHINTHIYSVLFLVFKCPYMHKYVYYIVYWNFVFSVQITYFVDWLAKSIPSMLMLHFPQCPWVDGVQLLHMWKKPHKFSSGQKLNPCTGNALVDSTEERAWNSGSMETAKFLHVALPPTPMHHIKDSV